MRILMIGAHQDDNEFRRGGLAHKYVQMGYDVRFRVCVTATVAKYRKWLIEKYGEERGSKIRYAEAFEVCPYGAPLTPELKEKLFPF